MEDIDMREPDLDFTAAVAGTSEAPLILAPEHEVSSKLAAFVRALDAEFEFVRRFSDA